jgi:hypothetical protein
VQKIARQAEHLDGALPQGCLTLFGVGRDHGFS